MGRSTAFYRKNKKARLKKKAYDTRYNKKTVADRVGRVLARRALTKAGKVRKGDGKDVHHKNGNPQDNRLSNLSVLSKKKNRGLKA